MYPLIAIMALVLGLLAAAMGEHFAYDSVRAGGIVLALAGVLMLLLLLSGAVVLPLA